MGSLVRAGACAIPISRSMTRHKCKRLTAYRRCGPIILTVPDIANLNKRSAAFIVSCASWNCAQPGPGSADTYVALNARPNPRLDIGFCGPVRGDQRILQPVRAYLSQCNAPSSESTQNVLLLILRPSNRSRVRIASLHRPCSA